MIGMILGLLAALLLTRIMSSLLFGVGTTDLTTFTVVSLLLTGIALLASYLPARRATTVDPMIAMRSE
jgi:ABC-type antimicrobial peptide transport system permease subunit